LGNTCSCKHNNLLGLGDINMTTAQLTGRIEMDLCPEWQYRQPAPVTKSPTRKRTGFEKKGVGLLKAFAGVVVDKMERSDTQSDRIVGYGLCGITMFYLTAHVVKALFL